MTRYISSNNDLRTEFIRLKKCLTFIYRHENDRPFRIETSLSAERSMDEIKKKNTKKVTPTVDILYVNIIIHIYIHIYICMSLRSSYAYLYSSRPLASPSPPIYSPPIYIDGLAFSL